MRGRLVALTATIALLALPVAASAHPADTNSFAFGAASAATAFMAQTVEDGGANFTTSDNMELLSFLSRDTPGVPNSFQDFISDLAFWGDTAYQGTFRGFRVIDIDDPRNPVQLLDFRDCANPNGAGQGDVVVWGSILVRSWDSNTGAAGALCDGETVVPGFEGVHVFDVSDPGNPDLVASVDLQCGSHTATGVPDVKNRRLLVYSTPSSGTCDGIDVVEVPLRAPENAALSSFEYAGRDAADADGFACHDTGVILGKAMKAACAGGVGFAVWSLGGKDGGSLDNPRFLYNHALPEIADVNPPNFDNPTGHSAAFSWDGDTLIFGHEPGGGVNPRCQVTGAPLTGGANAGPGIQSNDMKSFFFFDTESGVQLGKWTLTRPQTTAENCTLHNYNVVPTRRDDILVHGSYQSGIGVLDFSDPAAAEEIAFADPAPLPAAPNGAPWDGGDWSSYWYNGRIYESDIVRGFYAWKLDDPAVRGAMRLDHLNPQTQEFTIRGGERERDDDD